MNASLLFLRPSLVLINTLHHITLIMTLQILKLSLCVSNTHLGF